MGTARRNSAWYGVIAMLGLALLSIAYVAKLEFGQRYADALQVDELFFSVCAARGLSEGQLPVAGCHDNKGPVIYLVHQLVQLLSAPYNLLAIKGAAFFVVLLVACGVARVAFLLAGSIAAAAAAALVLQAFASNASHMALKTETVSVVFVLAGLSVLLGAQRPGPWRTFASGLLFGLAVLTKQTYALAAPLLVFWLWLHSREAPDRRLKHVASTATGFCFGMLVPFLGFLLMFYLNRQETEFLANFFIYPSVYGALNIEPLAKRWFWTFGAVVTVLSTKPLLSVLFVLAGAKALKDGFSGTTEWTLSALPRLLVLLVTVMAFAMIFAAPAFYSYHIVPVQVFMAVLGGALLSDLHSAIRGFAPRVSAYITLGLTAPSAIMATTLWYGTGHKPEPPEVDKTVVNARRGEYAYVLGMWPNFYTDNGLIPASNVMFPWALAHAPANGMYQPPTEGSLRWRWLAWAQVRSMAALQSDFRHTPPRYVVIVHNMARSTVSGRIADVPGFDEYLGQFCRFEREILTTDKREASLFRCNTSRAALSGSVGS